MGMTGISRCSITSKTSIKSKNSGATLSRQAGSQRWRTTDPRSAVPRNAEMRPTTPVGTLGCGVIQPTVVTLTHSRAGRNGCPAQKRRNPVNPAKRHRGFYPSLFSAFSLPPAPLCSRLFDLRASDTVQPNGS